MSVVIDSSITLAWIYSDETTEAVREVFQRVGKTGAWVPGLWRLEVANVLEMGARRKRHDAGFRDASIADLSRLAIQVDADTDQQAWSSTLKLATRHQLTTYDAAYLELALRRDPSSYARFGSAPSRPDRKGSSPRLIHHIALEGAVFFPRLALCIDY